MVVTSVNNSTAPVVGQAYDGPSNQMSSVDFMNLLVAELQNQNPLEPMSTTEMSSQLSQMTTNEQLVEIANTLDHNLVMSQSINNTAMLALVGREVTVEGDQVHVTDGESSGSMINSTGAGTATVTVRNDAGDVVATYPMEVERGLNDVGWDGLGTDGEPAPDGAYTVEVSVTNNDGDSVDATVLMTGAVGGLRYDLGLAVVSVFGQDFFVSEIYQVS